MIDSRLTIKQLNEIAKKLGIKIISGKKADMIKDLTQKSANLPNLAETIDQVKRENKKSQKRTSSKSQKPSSSKSQKPSSSKSIPLGQLKELVSRIQTLEQQMKFALERISELTLRSSQQGIQMDLTDLSEIRNFLMEQMKSGMSLSIDEIEGMIKSHPKFQQTTWESVENAILDMIDDEIFDASEGYSRIKIEGNIGRIIKR